MNAGQAKGFRTIVRAYSGQSSAHNAFDLSLVERGGSDLVKNLADFPEEFGDAFAGGG